LAVFRLITRRNRAGCLIGRSPRPRVNFLVTRVDVSADTVYAMTRAIFSNLTQLVQTHPAASGISLKDAMVGTPLLLHPGAERYYREVGILR